MTSSLLDPTKRRRRLAIVGLALLSLLGLAFYLRDVFNPLLIGLLLAYILNPLVEWLERKGVNRTKAVTVLFGAVLLLVTSTGAWAVFKAAHGLQDFRQRMVGERVLDPLDPIDATLIAHVNSQAPPAPYRPEATPEVTAPHPHAPYVRKMGTDYYVDLDDDGERKVGLVERAMDAGSAQLGDLHVGREEMKKLARGLESNASSFSEWGISLSQGMKRSFHQVGTFFSYLLLVPVYTFFLLTNFTRIRKSIHEHLPGLYRERIVKIAVRIDGQVAAFFRGKLMLCLLKGLVTSIGLAIVGVPLPFLIGMGAGLLSIVPFVGPLVGGSIAIILGFGEAGDFLPRLLGIVISFGAAEAVEAVAQPIILGREVGIDPLLLVLSFFVFGALFGMFGVLLAVPIMSIVKTLFEELVLPEVEALAAERREDAQGARPEPSHPAPAVPTFAGTTPAAAPEPAPPDSAPEE
ncbi:MAG: AI-2E family transporter [Planctomycetes bacterium]|nr:AI-2E family transporter [Planctomycetota bacterium]